MTSPIRRDPLIFGVEMEFLLKPRPALAPRLAELGWDARVDSNFKREGSFVMREGNRVWTEPRKYTENRKSFRLALANGLTAVGVDAGIVCTDYQDWSVVDEPSLDEVTGYWRVEFVSRTLSTAEPWQQEIDQVFQFLDSFCFAPVLTTGCSMHIHVSPTAHGAERYRADELRSILKAIGYFENAITSVMPPERKENIYALSNMTAANTDRKLKQTFRQIEENGWGAFFTACQKSVIFPSQAFLTMGSQRQLSWNFANLSKECGTIEFRRPPGIKTAHEAVHWAAFAIGFIKSAMDTDWQQRHNQRQHVGPEILHQFIFSGLRSLDKNGSCSAALDESKIAIDHREPTILTHEQLNKWKLKIEMRDSKESPFVTKANSRPNSPASSQGGSPRRS